MDRHVNFINNHPDSTWKARKYQPHELPHRNALGNTIQHYEDYKRPEGFDPSLLEVDTSDIPKEFDWTNVKGHSFVDPVINQGDCGSCYSVATSAMLSARSRILSKNSKKYRASPESVLSQCGFYAQGCQGGFPYLAAKYSQDFGATGWNKVTYTGSDNQQQCPTKTELVSRAKDYKYVGGYYGACSEQAMRRELFDHGPVVVGIEVAPSMQMYDSGVYDSSVHLPDQDHYERVNHAVLVTGFGEQDGKKYWNVQNSWGDTWGDGGYIKVARGKNTMNIEHMSVVAYPALTSDLPVKKATTYTPGKSMGHSMLTSLTDKKSFKHVENTDKFAAAISTGDTSDPGSSIPARPSKG